MSFQPCVSLPGYTRLTQPVVMLRSLLWEIVALPLCTINELAIWCKAEKEENVSIQEVFRLFSSRFSQKQNVRNRNAYTWEKRFCSFLWISEIIVSHFWEKGSWEKKICFFFLNLILMLKWLSISVGWWEWLILKDFINLSQDILCVALAVCVSELHMLTQTVDSQSSTINVGHYATVS